MELGLPSRMQGLYHWLRCANRLKSGDSSRITCWRLAWLSQYLMNEKRPLSICYMPGTVLYKTFFLQASYQACEKKSSSADSFIDRRLRTQPRPLSH